MAHETEKRLKELGIVLPRPPKAVGNYVPGVVVGNILYLAGTLGTQPDENDNDVLPYVGKVGTDLTIEQGCASARLMAINHLAMMKAVLGDLDRVKRCVKLGVFVNAVPGFAQQPEVANGASDLMLEVFGDAGRHARAAVGAGSLPRNVAVEVEAVFELA